MKKILIIIFLSFQSMAFSTQVTWETLKTLDVDPKTKGVVAKGELKKSWVQK